jgi:hypothetical protein
MRCAKGLAVRFDVRAAAAGGAILLTCLALISSQLFHFDQSL